MPVTPPEHLPDFIPGPSTMLFNSFEYLLVFLPLTAVIYFWLNRHTDGLYGKLWLVAASLFFYGWWSIAYLWLIGGSMLFNYGMARWLGQLRSNQARTVLIAAIACNLALLGYYKYADFFIGNINPLLNQPLPLLQLALPLGISFFTFTQIAFLADVYRGKAREYNLTHYFLFVTYFPHLIAGPIMHHKEMMPQFAATTAQAVNWKNIYLGLFILAIGLLKKVVLADSLATAANTGFNSKDILLFQDAWLSSLSYTLQLYFDFSGYTDMAIGASLIFNIRLPENFNSPYKARNIRDFWQRWHITLSRWLRDYLYIPLGGNRYGIPRSYAALIITFLLGGLWHGPSWTFVIWGLLHGAAAVLHRIWQQCNCKIPEFSSWLLTFLFVNFAWVFFRADDIATATNILKSMAGMHGFSSLQDMRVLAESLWDPESWHPFVSSEYFPVKKWLILLPCLLIACLLPNTAQLAQRDAVITPGWRAAWICSATLGFALLYTLFMASGMTTFIYFYF